MYLTRNKTGQNPVSVRKVFCRCSLNRQNPLIKHDESYFLTVPKSELFFCSYFFIFCFCFFIGFFLHFLFRIFIIRTCVVCIEPALAQRWIPSQCIASARQWAIPEKIQTSDGGIEDMEFPGVMKEHIEISEVNQKRSGISGGVLEILMLNFHGSWCFWSWNFQQEESHNFAEFPGVNACFVRIKWQI